MVDSRHGGRFGSGGLHGAFDDQNPEFRRGLGGGNIINDQGQRAANKAQGDFYHNNYADYPDAACDYLLNSGRVAASLH